MQAEIVNEKAVAFMKGSWLEAGAGRGIALIFIISALSLWITSTYPFANPRIRNLEEEIQDAIEEERLDDMAVPAVQTSTE